MKEFTLYRSGTKQNKENTYYKYKCLIASLSDLKNAVLYDHVSCAYKDGHRSKEDFISADCVMMDLDNAHSDNPEDWKTIDDISEAFPEVEFYYIESRNHMKPKQTSKGEIKEPRPKYHIYFPCDHVIDNPIEYEQLKGQIGALFPFFDTKCKDIAHFFFSVPEARGGENTC